MAPRLKDWERFTDFVAPVRIEHPDGTLVAYCEAARAEAADPDLHQAWKPEDLKLVLYSEMRAPIREISGVDVVEFKAEVGPVRVVVVGTQVPPDEGPTVETRGAEPPGS